MLNRVRGTFAGGSICRQSTGIVHGKRVDEPVRSGKTGLSESRSACSLAKREAAQREITVQADLQSAITTICDLTSCNS